MQKVIRRTILAEKQAVRRKEKKAAKLAFDWARTTREQKGYGRRLDIEQIKAARLARREDWELGPLAPRRDVGDSKETYGTVNAQRTRGQLLNEKERKDMLKHIGGRYMNIVVGDRVVLLEGRDKGKIGKISATDAKRGECTVEGLNMIDVAVPKWMLENSDDPDKRPVRSIEQPVPLNTVRLVYPLTDDEGKTRDVIVKKLVNGPIWHDRHTGATKWARLIPGLNILIPWPKQEPKEHKDFPVDTLRLDVEVKSFVPTLLRPPMPGSVIDELRNKYSIFRTRHDPEYIEAKIKEDQEKEEKKRQIEEMWTPLKEVNRAARKLRKAKGKGKLTPKMLERIGRVIAKKRQLTLDAVGVSKESAPMAAVAA